MIRCWRTRILLSIFLIVISVLLAACGNNGSPTTDSNGYVRFSLEWPSPFAAPILKELKGPLFAPSGDVCQDYEIENISVNVYTSSNALVTSGTFSCSAHTGFVATGPGTYTIIVDGISPAGADYWRGQKTGIMVSQGQTTDAGAVSMSYIGTDTVKPSITTTTPLNNAVEVPVSNAITAIFSENMAAFTIDTSTFIVSQGSVTVLGTVSYSGTVKTATFQPSSQLLGGTVYTATITTGVKDLALNPLAAKYSWSFTTTSVGGAGSGNWDSMIWDTDVWQ